MPSMLLPNLFGLSKADIVMPPIRFLIAGVAPRSVSLAWGRPLKIALHSTRARAETTTNRCGGSRRFSFCGDSSLHFPTAALFSPRVPSLVVGPRPSGYSNTEMQ